MRKLFVIMIIISGLGLMWSCEKDQENPVLDMNEIFPPVLVDPVGGESYVLEIEYKDSVLLSFTWQAMSYPLEEIANAIYAIEVAVAGEDFDRIRTVISTEDLTAPILVERLNNALIGLGAVADEPADFEFRIRGIVNASNVSEKLAAYSGSVTMTFTPYEPPIFMLNVPGSYQGWNVAGPPYLWSMDDNSFSGYIFFPDASTEYKFAKGAWDEDTHWSYAGPGMIVQGGGPNFQQSGAGAYWFNVNLEALTFSIERRDWGIHIEGEDEDMPMVYDPEMQVDHSCILTLTADFDAGTEFVFRANNDEDIIIGNIDPADGVSAEHSGDPIVIEEAGNYTIILNLTEITYTYEIIKND